MQFLDRENELALLVDHLERKGAGFFVLYGRRRIGKTELLRRVLAGRLRAAYHVATRSTAVEELGRLSATLARDWEQPFLATQALASAEAFLAYLETLRGPHVLVLDEFPCLTESDASLPGLLQAAWDRSLSKGDLKLVVCGSSVSVMESTFLSPRAPLYGRRTGQLRLGPLPVRSLARAFPGPPTGLVELAAVFGCVPGYLQRLDPNLAVLDTLGLVDREVPVTEPRPDRSRKGLYRVTDPFVGTWFALVHPFRDLLESGRIDRAWPQIEERLAQRMPFAIEPVVRELFLQTMQDRVPFPVVHAGRHWGPGAEFDAVFLDAERRRAFVLEIKWTQEPAGVGSLGDLRRKAACDPVLASLDRTCAVVSRAGFRGRVAASDRKYMMDVAEMLA